MAIMIPEDGTGLPDANSYCDLAFADAFATARGYDLWMGQSPTLKEKYLVQAADYIDRNYRFKGQRTTTGQALSFPRAWIPRQDVSTFIETVEYPYYPSDEVPDKVKRAAVEYAMRAAKAAAEDLDLQPDPAENATGTIVDKFEKVGLLEERTKWSGHTPPGKPSYPAADRWLQEFVVSGNQLERA